MKLITETGDIEIGNMEFCVGARDVEKVCPYCRINNVVFVTVLFHRVTSAVCSCGKTVYIEMIDPFYYRVF